MVHADSSGHEAIGTEPIAIVGLGCRFPGADGPAEYWRLLCSGRDSMREVPEGRWNVERFASHDVDRQAKMSVYRGGFLDANPKEFDAAFFGISGREARYMDPQQRLVMEVAWEALEDAGMDTARLAGSATGVYLAAFTMDHTIQSLNPLSRELIDSNCATGGSMTMISNRLSYFFDLHGPSMTVDTACSGSLVAVHLACQALWSEDCELALAGGVNVMMRPEYFIVMSKGRFLSPDGKCKSFDAAANGYARGEGAGIVVLKRLSAALRDRDLIYALIRGTGVNQDGRTEGITFPSARAQEALIRKVAGKYALPLSQVRYVEAHGTGTAVGDPIEAEVLGKTVGAAQTDGRVCFVGSAKATIGHLEAAAGVAGLIKATLCAHFGAIPPQAGLETPNPKIPFEQYKLRLPLTVEPLPHGDDADYLCVNAFGYGGTNAHVILERYGVASVQPSKAEHQAEPEGLSGSVARGRPAALLLSAKSANALQASAHAYAELLKAPNAPPLADVCNSAFQFRTQLAHRLVAVASSHESMVRELVGFAERQRSEHTVSGKLLAAPEPNPVFVFTGMGPQWWGMGRELYGNEPVFRDTADAIDQVFRSVAGYSILRELLKDEASSRMAETQIAQAANFVLQISLFELLRSWGVQPAAVVGHSVGEVSAAYASGVLGLEDAVLLAHSRGRVQAAAAGKGAMLAVGLGADQTLRLLNGHVENVSIAAMNGPTTTTLSGARESLESIAAELQRQGTFHRWLRVEVPYHSHYMEPLKPALRDALARLAPRRPRLPLYSTVTGDVVNEAALDAEYWCNNMREPVLFAAAISAMIEAGHCCFLEVGPHPVLANAINELLKHFGKEGRVASSLQREKPEAQNLLEALGALHVAGSAVDWRQVLGPNTPRVKLPHYPFQRQSHWLESAANAHDRLSPIAHPLLGSKVLGPAIEYELDLDLDSLDYLQDHVVDGLSLFPGAGYVEQGLALQALLDAEAVGATIENLEFKQALIISGKRRPRVRVVGDAATREFGVYAQSPEGADGWTLHAAARICSTSRGPAPHLDIQSLRADAGLQPVDREHVYEQLALTGLKYGPAFQAIAALWRRPGAALARLECRAPAGGVTPNYRLYPALLDAAFQTTAFSLRSEDLVLGPYLPISIKRAVVWGSPSADERLWSYCEVTHQSADAVEANVALCDEQGRVFAQMTGLRCQALPTAASRNAGNLSYRVAWELEPWQIETPALGPWLLVGSDSESARALGSELRALGAVDAEVSGVADASELATRLEREWGGVVYLAPSGKSDAEFDVTPALAELLSLTQSLLSGPGKRPRLYIVTSNAQQIERETLAGLMQSPLVGFGRSVQAEHPELACTLIDFDRAEQDCWREVAEELTAGKPDSEVALRGSRRYVCRVERAANGQANEAENTITLARAGACKLEVRTTGRLESLRFRSFVRRTPGAREIEIEIRATALNFKDVLKALGMLPAKATEGSYSASRLGLEASGVVVAVGDAVTEYAVGDPLVLAVADSFASHVMVNIDSMFAVRKPAGISFAEAASLPVTFMTAYYGLHEVARLKAGETVLIHAAAGGVGLAAIQVARWLGAKIIATAGRDAKRDYLKSLGVEHVLNSRDLAFVDEIGALTAGKGVDVVLNSIGGETLLQSLSLLAPLGRFVEIGKRDIVENKKLPLLPFNRNLSFTAFDLDRIMAEQPDLLRRLFGEVWERFRSRDFTPTVFEVFPAAQIETAFRHMAQSNHTGKVVISFEDAGDLPVLPMREGLRIDPDATYLVTGGLGGFGSKVALWLARKGAQNLVLVGRSGVAGDAAKTLVQTLKDQGVNVRVAAVDVSRETDVRKVLTDMADTLPPLRGVIHAAAVLDDALIEHLDPARLEAVLAPKARGAWNLHRLTSHIPLDFFVLFSSVVSVVGNVGQSNYVAANAFVDALALHRVALGLPATSINWGPLSEVGMAARDEKLLVHLERAGMRALSPSDALVGLEAALEARVPQLAIMDLDWTQWAKVNRSLATLKKFSPLVERSEASDDEPTRLRTMLIGTEPGRRTERLAGVVAEIVAETMSTTADNIDVQRPLSELGIHSMMAVELQMNMQARIGVEFPILELTKKGNLYALAADLLVRMNLSPTAETETESVPRATRPPEVPSSTIDTPQRSNLARVRAPRAVSEQSS